MEPHILETLEARIAPEHTALLIIDMQKDFVLDGLACDQAGRDLTATQSIIPALTRLLAAATLYLQNSYRGRGLLTPEQGIRYNDVPSVAYAINPDLFGVAEYYVTIETQSTLSRGQTLADRRGSLGKAPNARVCMEVDSEGLTALFTERVTGYSAG